MRQHPVLPGTRSKRRPNRFPSSNPRQAKARRGLVFLGVRRPGRQAVSLSCRDDRAARVSRQERSERCFRTRCLPPSGFPTTLKPAPAKSDRVPVQANAAGSGLPLLGGLTG